MTSTNSNYFSRFGNIDDLVYLEKLLIETKEHRKNSSKSWSYPFDDRDFDIASFMKIAVDIILDVEHAKNKIVLVFDHEENIKCVSIAMFWNMIKSWRQGIILCRPSSLYFNAVENGISEASTMLISYAENMGYYSYDFIVANPKNDHRWNRMRAQIPIINNRYDFFDEAIIPANTMPSHSRYRQMMRNRTWNVDLLYRIGYLKNEYRKKDLLISL